MLRLGFGCDWCRKSFTTESSLKEHAFRKHGVGDDGSKVSGETPRSNGNDKGASRKKKELRIKCPTCHEKLTRFGKLISHFLEKHHLAIEKEELKFFSDDEFNAWKEQEEVKEQCRFTCKMSLREHSRLLLCHRSGYFKQKGNGTLKKDFESMKIDATCPARMLMKRRFGAIVVTYYKTHVGHTAYSDMFLPKPERTGRGKKKSSSAVFDEVKKVVPVEQIPPLKTPETRDKSTHESKSQQTKQPSPKKAMETFSPPHMDSVFPQLGEEEYTYDEDALNIRQFFSYDPFGQIIERPPLTSRLEIAQEQCTVMKNYLDQLDPKGHLTQVDLQLFDSIQKTYERFFHIPNETLKEGSNNLTATKPEKPKLKKNSKPVDKPKTFLREKGLYEIVQIDHNYCLKFGS